MLSILLNINKMYLQYKKLTNTILIVFLIVSASFANSKSIGIEYQLTEENEIYESFLKSSDIYNAFKSIIDRNDISTINITEVAKKFNLTVIEPIEPMTSFFMADVDFMRGKITDPLITKAQCKQYALNSYRYDMWPKNMIHRKCEKENLECPFLKSHVRQTAKFECQQMYTYDFALQKIEQNQKFTWRPVIEKIFNGCSCLRGKYYLRELI